jgi:hypothetical protein
LNVVVIAWPPTPLMLRDSGMVALRRDSGMVALRRDSGMCGR